MLMFNKFIESYKTNQTFGVLSEGVGIILLVIVYFMMIKFFGVRF